MHLMRCRNKACLLACREETPATLDFKVMEGSMYNTPPCWAIYMCGLVFNHMLRNGGIEAMQKTNKAKAKVLYDAIDGSDGFYVNPIAKANRSNMNVPFTIPSSQELEAVFVKEAAAAGMVSTLCARPSETSKHAGCICMHTDAESGGTLGALGDLPGDQGTCDAVGASSALLQT